jgi:hypothetical protein
MKAVVFIILLFFFIIPVGLFTLVILKVIKNTKGDAWTGEVTDKVIKEKEEDDNKTKQYYSLVVKTDAGQIRKLAVTLSDYNTWKVGDKVEKIKGELNPHKIK